MLRLALNTNSYGPFDCVVMGAIELNSSDSRNIRGTELYAVRSILERRPMMILGRGANLVDHQGFLSAIF